MSKDRKTKFRINTFSSRKRSYKDGAKKVYKDMKDRCYDQFLEAKKNGRKFSFTTDKLEHYRKGFKKYFLNVATLTHGVPIKCQRHGLKRNNNCIERDHQYSRKLEKLCRGHKDFFGVSAVFDVGDAYYNYIDRQQLPFEKKPRTPAERASLDIRIGERFQLLNLIKMSYPED